MKKLVAILSAIVLVWGVLSYIDIIIDCGDPINKPKHSKYNLIINAVEWVDSTFYSQSK